MVLLYFGDIALVIVMALYCCVVVSLYGCLPLPPELYTFVATLCNLSVFFLILSVALHVFVLVWHVFSVTLHSFSAILHTLVLNPRMFALPL